MVQLHHKISEIRAAGAELIVIGNGAPMFMDGFRETTGYDGPLYTDPSLAVYKAAGLKRGIGTVLSGRAALAGLRALKGGFRQGRTQGDPTQQGGVLVIAPSGDVLLAQVSEFAGDNAPPERVLAALTSLREA